MKKVLFSFAILSVSAGLSAQTAMPDFSKLGYKKSVMYTSSKGEFEEFHDQTDVVEIGTALFNTKTNQVVGFVSEKRAETDVASATTAMSVDPMCEKYYWISPYAYCLNNPIRFVDQNGKDPGDFFQTINAAVKDWGKYYNGASILRSKEFSSSIYSLEKNGKSGYTYSVANIGEDDNVKASSPPDGKETKAIIHSHGSYEEGYLNNDFSPSDKWTYYDAGINGFVTTPDGSLKKYNVNTTEVTTISKDMPSDPNDPGRKNKIEPTDIPMEKKRVQTTIEQDKKPELKIPETEWDKIHLVF